ncbi:N-acetylneuraminate synthase [bacterium]|nr:N-acetylneuraminate synthase [bacterium]
MGLGKNVTSKRCNIIAEIGVNHNGDLDLAYKMIDVAKSCGADAVKYQTFSADALVTYNTPKVAYQNNTTSTEESHYEMIRKLELPWEDHHSLFQFCKSIGIEFISTPYDIESALFLDELGVQTYKTASADIVDLPLHELLAGLDKPVIIATGMASLGEIETVISLYRERNNNKVTLLHCVSNYPCSDASLNLRVMATLQQAFHVPVGFSDHSIGSDAAMIAIALGATVIEKHFTLDKDMTGPDHKASADPKEFSELVQKIRKTELMLGSPVKRIQTEECQMAEVSRKSVTLSKSMMRNEIIERSHLSMKRPGTGLSASDIPKLLGKKVRSNFPKNHQLKWTDLND